jgi:hypothetical protein
MLLDLEDVQIRLVIGKALYQIHHLHYQDVILQCQVNCLLIIYVITYYTLLFNTFVLIILNLGSPLESPKVVHSHPHFPFVSIKR